MFCQHTLQNLLKGKSIRQVNHTLTRRKGAIRGLHFQYPPFAEVKIVTCLRGKVWDVAVDLRKGSPTFLHHHAVLLTQEKLPQLSDSRGLCTRFPGTYKRL